MTGYQRWQNLYDRQQRGDVLSVSELAELDQLSAHEPAASCELGLISQLEQLECELVGSDAAVVERALCNLTALHKVVPIRGRSESRPGVPHGVKQQQSARRSWRRPALFALAAAAALCGFAAIGLTLSGSSELGGPPQQVIPERAAVELTLAAGEVIVNGKPGVVTALAVEPGSKIVVGAGRACLALDTKTDVCLDADTEVVLDDQKGSARSLELVRGRVAAALDKRPAEGRFSISTSTFRTTALGTAFSVETGSSEPAKVTVMQGTVRVSLAEALRDVSVNQQLKIAEGKLGVPRSITRAERLRHASLIEVRKLWQQPSVSMLHVNVDPSDAVVSLDGVVLGHAPLSLVAPSGARRLSVEHSVHQPYEQLLRLEPGQTEHVRIPLTPNAKTDEPDAARAGTSAGAPAVAPERVPSAEELLVRARSLVQAGQWQAAVVAYRKLRRLHPNSAESHTVLVALGQLELDRLGQPAQALRSFNRYLKSRGGLAQEASFGKVRALRALGNTHSERKAIEAHIARYPKSADARALRRRLLELERSDSQGR